MESSMDVVTIQSVSIERKFKNIMKEHFSGMFDGAAPFEFFKENNIKMQALKELGYI